jgi:hypothetical protein
MNEEFRMKNEERGARPISQFFILHSKFFIHLHNCGRTHPATRSFTRSSHGRRIQRGGVMKDE